MRLALYKSLGFSMITFGLALSGCGDALEGLTGEEDDSELSSEASEFDGTWSTGCVQSSDATEYERTTFVISGTSVTLSYGNYPLTDTTCSSLTYGFGAQSTFVVEGDSTVVSGARNVKVDIVSISVTLEEDALDAKICGKSADANRLITVTAVDCVGEEDFEGAFDSSYDLWQVTGSGLLFGSDEDDDLDGSTAAKRPTSLDTATVYTKQ